MEAAQGLVLTTTKPAAGVNPVENEPNAGETLPPMMKLTMFCATKGEGSTNPKQ